jgi:HEAT repeat protein
MFITSSKTFACSLALSLLMTLGHVPSWAKSTAGGMTQSAIVSGEKRAAQSYGESIVQSDLIVLGEYKTEGKVVVKTVLKGANSWVGKTIALAEPLRMGCISAPIPNLKNAAVLMRAGGKAQNSKSVVTIYDTPDQIAYVKLLVPAYSKPSEQARLIALSGYFSNPKTIEAKTFEDDPTATFKAEFVWAIKQMREPKNFELVKKLYLEPSLSEQNKLALQEWMADTRDERALQVLIDATQSKNKNLERSAICSLMWYYPCERSDAALSKAVSSAPADTRPSVIKYLKARKVKSIPANITAPPLTPYQRAEELRQNGKNNEAQEIYLSILESKEDNSYLIRAATLAILRQSNSDKHSHAVKQFGAASYSDATIMFRIIKARIEWLTHDAATGNYLEASDTADILRQLHSSECTNALITLISRRESLFNKANKTATMAILELGPTARKKASSALLKQMSTTIDKQEEQIQLLTEFAWIKQAEDLDKAITLLKDKQNWASALSTVHPLLFGIDETNESSSLLRLLDQRATISPAVVDWIVFRLGELHETRAVDLLAQMFSTPSYSPSTITEALMKIGGSKVISKMEAIATDSKSPYQGTAIDVLINCQKEKALPLLRKVLKSGTLDGKVHSLAGISRLGNCDDRKALLPLADYWTGERDIHYWVVQALIEIQTRCHCI